MKRAEAVQCALKRTLSMRQSVLRSAQPNGRRSAMKTAIVLAIAYLVSIVITPATTLLFDELSPSNLPTNYSGFQWSGWLVANDAPILPPNLYSNAIVSPHNVIGNIDGRSTTLGNGPAFLFFNLNSAYLTAEYNDGLQIEVQGFSGGAMVYDNTYTINATSPSFVQFDYPHVNAIK